MSSASEIELIARCKQQDRHAQKQLYEQYSKAMYTVAYRIVNDEVLAHDALQEAFFEVFRDLASYKAMASLGSWIKTIVVRKALLRLKQEQKQSSESLSENDDPIVWPADLAGEDLAKAIARLPQGYRSVFVLVEVGGYSHKDASQLLDIAESTSRSQLHHAKKLLRDELRKEGYR